MLDIKSPILSEDGNLQSNDQALNVIYEALDPNWVNQRLGICTLGLKTTLKFIWEQTNDEIREVIYLQR